MIKHIVPRLAEGGKIKIGGLGPERRSTNGTPFRPPVKYDHFLVTTTDRDANGDLVVDEELMALLPKDADGKCREIPIVVHDDDLERVFPTTYALYAGRKLFCRGDGESAMRYVLNNKKERTGEMQEIACTCDYLDKGHCRPHGTLHCSIRVPSRAVAGSVYMWRTTSQMSIEKMLGSLQHIQNICGTICGIPLTLVLEEVQVSPVGAPSSTVYVCHVELRATDIAEVQRQAIAAAQMRARVRGGYLIALPGVDEDEITESEVQQEFHPENGGGDETGEQASAEQIAQLNLLIDRLEERNEGAAFGVLRGVLGGAASDLESITIRQYETVSAALQQAFDTTIQQPRRASASNGGAGDAPAQGVLVRK